MKRARYFGKLTYRTWSYWAYWDWGVGASMFSGLPAYIGLQATQSIPQPESLSLPLC